MKTVAVILGSGIGALGVLRSLSRVGISCYSYDSTPGIETASRWYKALPDGDGDASLPERLEKLPAQRIVLFPCSDSLVRFAATLQRSNPERFIQTLPSADSIERFLDKSLFRELLSLHAVPHPKTIEILNVKDIDKIPLGEEASYYLRPGDPLAFSRIFGVRGLRAKSRPQLISFISDIMRCGFSISAQEILPGPPTSHIYLEGLFLNSQFAGLFARRRLRMYPQEFGVSSSMISIDLSETLNAEPDLNRLLTDTGYTGLFSAEFKVVNNVARLIEFIPRTWIYIEHASRAGLNIPQLAYLAACGQGTPNPTYRKGFKMTFAQLDRKALGDNSTSLKQYFISVAKEHLDSQHFLLSPDDPLPGLKESIADIVKRLAKLLNRAR